MSERSDGTRLVAATQRHRVFVGNLSAEVFARFGRYEEMLPAMIGREWVRTVVAETERGPVGFAIYSLESIADSEIDLVAIAVLPERQSRGIGRALLEHVESSARKLVDDGPASVRLTVALDNDRARRLFENSGYVAIPGETGFYDGGQPSIGLRKKLR